MSKIKMVELMSETNEEKQMLMSLELEEVIELFNGVIDNECLEIII